jgi:uncharacterized lipoprotein YmbA
MITVSPSRRRVVAVLALLPALSACSTTPSPRLFTLAPRAGTPNNKFSGTISVRRAELAKYLDRPEIVSYSDPYELSMSEYVRWGEGLGDMVTRVLVEDLAQRLPLSRPFAASGPLTLPSPDVTIEINIDRFGPDPSGAVVLAAQWVAHRERRADWIQSERIEVPLASSNDTTAQVAAMSDALGRLADRIASGLAA